MTLIVRKLLDAMGLVELFVDVFTGHHDHGSKKLPKAYMKQVEISTSLTRVQM